MYTTSNRASLRGGQFSYDSGTSPLVNYTWIYNFDQNFTKIHGRHEFLFGARLRLENIDTLEDQQVLARGTQIIPWASQPLKALDKICR